MLKINGQIIPQDFIERHGDISAVEGFRTSMCRCGVDLGVTGTPGTIIRSRAFKNHLAKAFKTYKARHALLLGGGVSG